MKYSPITCFVTVGMIVILVGCSSPAPVETQKSTTYPQLVELFKTWREFQNPVMKEGVPDYSVAAMKHQHEELKSWQQKLQNFDTTTWPINHQADWYILYAEMNGLDFDHRVLRTWERDPAFYKTVVDGTQRCARPRRSHSSCHNRSVEVSVSIDQREQRKTGQRTSCDCTPE